MRSMSDAHTLPHYHWVGFCGHRQLAAPDTIRGVLRNVLRELRQAIPGEWIAVSSLAAGADTLFCQTALAERMPCHVVLPLPPVEFRRDFSETDWRAVESLLAEAERVQVISDRGDREEAYLDAGFEIVEACDVLIAVWDGQPARGKGGTADVVAYAREFGKPLIWVDAHSGEVRRERWERILHEDREVAFLNRLPAASAEASASSNPFDAPPAVARLLQKADFAASRGAPKFRLLIASTVLLHVAATLVAAGALAFDLHWTALPWLKLLCVTGALAVAIALRQLRSQHLWVRCRLAAEVSRSALATWGLPRAVTLLESLDAPELEGLIRSLQVLHGRSLAKKAIPLATFKERYLEGRIDDQLSYYERRLARALPQLTRLRWGFSAATLLAIVCTAAYAIDHTWHAGWLKGGPEYLVYYFLPISLPVIAAALMSLISINDLHRRVARYREMQHLLKDARKQLKFAQSWHGVERIVHRTERALLQEVTEWRTLMSHLESH